MRSTQPAARRKKHIKKVEVRCTQNKRGETVREVDTRAEAQWLPRPDAGTFTPRGAKFACFRAAAQPCFRAPVMHLLLLCV